MAEDHKSTSSGSAQKWWDGAVKIVAPLSVAALLAIFTTVVSMRGDILVIQSEIGHLREQVGAQMDDRYRGTQAQADLALRDTRLSALDAQISQLTAEFRAHVASPFHTSAIEARLAALERHLERLSQLPDGR